MTKTLGWTHFFTPILGNNVSMSHTFRTMFVSGPQIQAGHICYPVFQLRQTYSSYKEFSIQFCNVCISAQGFPHILQQQRCRSLKLLCLWCSGCIHNPHSLPGTHAGHRCTCLMHLNKYPLTLSLRFLIFPLIALKQHCLLHDIMPN